MVRSEGPRALYKGSSAALASVVLENAVLFTANNAIKKGFKTLGASDARGELGLAQHALAGGLAGVFSSTAICPAEVVKCNLQIQTARAATALPVLPAMGVAPLSLASAAAVSGAVVAPTGVIAATVAPAPLGPIGLARAIVRAEGVRGLFKGLPSLWARDIPFNFAFLGSYEAFCGVLAWSLETDRSSLGAGATLVAGGLAGVSGWSVVFPMDVVKSRMQTSAPGRRIGHVIGDLYRAGGVRAFYRGWTAAVARAFPANAALLMGFELSHRLFRSSD